MKMFVFHREPEGRRGKEFPSVKTEKIKLRFVISFSRKSLYLPNTVRKTHIVSFIKNKTSVN